AAFERGRKRSSYSAFRERAAAWLEDFALFSALRSAAGGAPWIEWERELRLRRPGALSRARRELASEIEFHRFQQWLFDGQWRSFKRHANRLGIGLAGDLPFFVAHDSADVWAHRDAFELDGEGRPTVVAGVPPDFFSTTGQLWGNPHYRWSRLKQQAFRWWIDRFEHELERFDALRLDHFIGFWPVWQLPGAPPPTPARTTTTPSSVGSSTAVAASELRSRPRGSAAPRSPTSALTTRARSIGR